ncbi:MAG TPA: helix-hairpin-helix domain-containing protein, partial [Acidimicrobiales bacterium]|nr:helix-hairpin-helix domain-containing protein [Acidimicrobiales bacterium]
VAMLSVLSPGALSRAVLSGDADALTLVPGIGKKTAARLVLELAPRFEAAAIIDIEAGAGSQAHGAPAGVDESAGSTSASTGSAHGAAPVGAPHEASAADRAARRDEVRAALTALGYGLDEIRQALARLPLDGPAPELLRSALRELAGRA